MNIRVEEPAFAGTGAAAESSASAVSWSAIWVGAAIAAATSLLLVVLGSGLGFASVSPWRGEGPSATTFTVTAAIWLIMVQWIASGLGGYITGRVRTKWVNVHTHEIAIRDTTHGFATWAVATLITVGLIAYATIGTIGGAAKIASATTSGIAQAGMAAASSGGASSGAYEIDSLFRTAGEAPVQPEVRAEALRILVRGISTGSLSPEDERYLSESVAARTGISQSAAEQRVAATFDALKATEVKARDLANAARKAASAAALCTALSMLVGAFIASVAAALGGRQRDEHP